VTFDQALAGLVSAREATPRIVDQAIDQVGQQALARLLDMWPVATGRSAAAWEWTGDALSNDVDYVPYVHLGLAGKLIPRIFSDLEDTFRELVESRLDAAGGFHG
jgi:hypothetical protein